MIDGNGRGLQGEGNLTGDGVKYGDNGAMAGSTDFTAKIPDLNAQDATVNANTHATFVTLGGQNINDLQAKTDYHQKEVDFDATAKQPQRSLAIGGGLLLHPDHEEVHLRQLSLQSQNVSW